MIVPLNPADNLTKEYLVASITEESSVHIEALDEFGMVLWDDEDAKFLPIHFTEKLNPDILSDMIHISKDIPQAYQIDKSALAHYLWDVCDKNAFITLNELVVIWSEADDLNHPERCGEFKDSESTRMYNEYSDEYAYEIGADVLGQLWFERNIAVINMGEIVRIAEKVAKENNDLEDFYFSFENQFQTAFLTTVLHELRHLQMETNIFLPEIDYPLNLASEDAVESYCRDTFESHGIDTNIFQGLYDKPSLGSIISSAQSRAIAQQQTQDNSIKAPER